MALTAEQRERIIERFHAYLAGRFARLRRLRLSEMNFNVVALRSMATLLELDSPDALIRYRFAQFTERGFVTAMGGTLQEIAKIAAASPTGVAGADIEIDRDGTRYYIQVKSGPTTANKDIAQNIQRLLASARRLHGRGAVVLLGVCYGTRAQMSAIAADQLEPFGVDYLIGREFWDFITGNEDSMAELLELAAIAAARPLPDGLSFRDSVEGKIASLTAEFRTRSGDELDTDAWERLLEEHS
jgi:hypothetical protein